MRISKKVAPVYDEYLFDGWLYKHYVLIGGYGAGRTWHTVYKIVMRLYESKQTAIVAAPNVKLLYQTFMECSKVLSDLGVLARENQFRFNKDMLRAKYEPGKRKKPMRIIFHNGSRILFVPLDMEPDSNFFYNVSTLWIARAHLARPHDIEVLKDRIIYTRTNLNIIYTANTLGKDNWLYKEYFRILYYDETETIKLDEYKLYDKKYLVKDDTLYIHTVASDNQWCDRQYLRELDLLQYQDNRLYMQARWGRFVSIDRRIFPHIEVVWRENKYYNNVAQAPIHYYGLSTDGKTVVCITENPNRTQSGLLVYDKVDLTSTDKIAEAWKAKLLSRKVPICVSTSMDSLVVEHWINKGYNIMVVDQPVQVGIEKMQQYIKIQVAPEQDKMYREIKGLTYNLDDNYNPVYDWYSGEINYIYGIANALAQVDVHYIHRSIC